MRMDATANVTENFGLRRTAFSSFMISVVSISLLSPYTLKDNRLTGIIVQKRPERTGKKQERAQYENSEIYRDGAE